MSKTLNLYAPQGPRLYLLHLRKAGILWLTFVVFNLAWRWVIRWDKVTGFIVSFES